MPFLLPILPALIGAGAAAGGTAIAAKQAGQQNKALGIQEQIAQQEMADKQKIFDLLKPFFEQYLGKGSPFLSMIQRAGAEQNAQQFSNAAGQVRNTMATSGLGFGPSGATAAAVGGLGAEAAKSASSDFLTNLLNNEQLKFQAAQGLNAVGGMAGGSQNQPNVGVSLPAYNTGSSLTGLAQALGALIKPPGGGGNTYGSAGGSGGFPNPGVWDPMGPSNPTFPGQIPTSVPTVGGYSGPGFGPD